MELYVKTLCAYYSAQKIDDQGNKWNSTKFCLAVKANDVREAFSVPYGGGTRFSPVGGRSLSYARQIFGNFIKECVATLDVDNYWYIPSPSKDSFEIRDFRTLRMVRQAVGTSEAGKVLPAIVFNTKRIPASKGGPREYHDVFPFLKVVDDFDLKGKSIVLIDDIVTLGGSLLACQTIVEQAGGRVVMAIACGRTDENEAEPFSRKMVHVFAHERLI